MKITKLLFIGLLVVSMAFCVFATEATEPDPVVWDASQSSIIVTAYYSYYTNVTYTAPTTGKYALTWSTSPVKHFAVMEPGPESYTIDGVEYEVFDLTAGQQLLLRVFSDEITDPGVTYSQTLTMQPWDGSLLLPDYPYIAEGQKVSVNLAPGQSLNYLFQANTDGLYTQGQSHSSHWVNLYQLDGYASPEMVTPWSTDTQNGHIYRLSAGNIYQVEVSSSGGPQVADEIWIRAGDAPKNEYPVWTEGQKNISLSSGESKRFFFTPSQSGEYALYRSNTTMSATIYEGVSVRDFSTGGQYHGEIFMLNAGQQYVIEVSDTFGGSNATVFLEKTRKIASAEIYLAQSDPGAGSYVLAVKTDPVYAYAEGVRWSISDEKLFNIIQSDAVMLDLKATGQGTATVTAVVDGITCTYQLSTGDVPGSGSTTGSSSSGTTGTTDIGGSAQQTPTGNAGVTDSTQPTSVTNETTVPETNEETAEQTTAPQNVAENIISCLELSALAEGESYAISLEGCDLIWDAAAVKSLLEQTVAAELTLNAANIELSELNDAQQNAIARRETGFILDLSICDIGAYIHSFGDGTVTVKIPFVPEQGRNWNICYLAEDGTLEQLEVWEEDGQICFKTDHFSVFALLYEQEAQSSLTWLIWVGAGVVITAAAAAGTVWYLKKKKA